MTAWTADRIETLRRMWGEGASASLIAERLGGISRSAVLGKANRLGLSEPVDPARPARKPRAPRKPRPVCGVQGCGRTLSKQNLSGVCFDHAHVAPHCRCPKCRCEAVQTRAAPVARPHVRTALVASTAQSNDGSLHRIPVSLRREPWVTE